MVFYYCLIPRFSIDPYGEMGSEPYQHDALFGPCVSEADLQQKVLPVMNKLLNEIKDPLAAEIKDAAKDYKQYVSKCEAAEAKEKAVGGKKLGRPRLEGITKFVYDRLNDKGQFVLSSFDELKELEAHYSARVEGEVRLAPIMFTLDTHNPEEPTLFKRVEPNADKKSTKRSRYTDDSRYSAEYESEESGEEEEGSEKEEGESGEEEEGVVEKKKRKVDSSN